MTSDQTSLRMLAIVVFGLIAVSCDDRPDQSNAFDRNDDLAWAADGDAADLGQDWLDEVAPPGSVGRSMPTTYWTVLLGTFSGPGHAEMAANLTRSCAEIDMGLSQTRVHTTRKGSMVIYGVFEEVADPGAQRELKRIKGIARSGRQVFPNAMLTHITINRPGRRFRPNELMSVRQRYPDLHPLYSLQIGVWGDFDSGKLTDEKIQRAAESYAQNLRSRGFQAYFHHTPGQGLSMVTVGLFDHTAIDGASTLDSPELEYLRKQFPIHMVNGEEFREFHHRLRPELGTRPQEPRLVLVPKLE